MAAYVIVNIDVKEPIQYEEYKALAAPAVAAYGGRYLVRGGRAEVLEGEWRPKRCVILQFDSVDQARLWWNSPEYSAAKAIRHQTASSDMVVVEGV
jgi:uncharacterized protein (DUF1330 family)